MKTWRKVGLLTLLGLLAQASYGQVALRSVTSARNVTITHGTPAQDREEPSRETTSPLEPAGSFLGATPADTDRTVRPVQLKSTPSDPEKERATAMFSKFLLAFNDKEYSKRIMAQQGPSYRLEDWYYFPVRIKSLTSRKVEDQIIMVNPATGKYQLEGAAKRTAAGS